MAAIVARDKEVKRLDEIYSSKEAEFIAIYGRRRVGKTFLISEYFKAKENIYFELTGLQKAKLPQQLKNFTKTFSDCFYNGLELEVAKNWHQAFAKLSNEIIKIDKKQKIIIFLDELPWLATKRSGLLQSLDYYWNTQWSRMANIRLIVCGSAASWMLNNIINAKGGLHNRVTQTILLKPLHLSQTEIFLKSRHVKLKKKQVLDIFMVMGGIPHYLKQIKPNLSPSQNINRICFQEDGLLFTEFPRLFKSLFINHELNLDIVKIIQGKRQGISRNELLKSLGISSGGLFNKCINELVAAGFVEKIVPHGKKAKQHYFRIIDEYTVFYFKWIEPLVNKSRRIPAKGYWQKLCKSPSWYSWAGYAFEEICYKHIQQISHALELDDIVWYANSWRYIPTKKNAKEIGAQIDLLFDRSDEIITICEIKFCEHIYTIDKAYAKQLINKIEVFEKHQPSNKSIHLAMISCFGTKPNIWSEDLIQNQVTLNDLFAE